MTGVRCSRWYEEPWAPTTRRRRHERSLVGIWTYPVCTAAPDMGAERASESAGAGGEVGYEVAQEGNVAAFDIDEDSTEVEVLEAGCLWKRVSRPAV